MVIRDYWLQDVLIEENLPTSPGLTLEFGFDLLGNSPDDSNGSGANGFLQFSQNFTHSTVQEWRSAGRLLKIDLHLMTQNGSQTFSPDQSALIPAELQRVIDENDDYWHTSLGLLAPGIQLVLQQILNCPYTGSIQQVYL